jgi:hypothetical protein
MSKDAISFSILQPPTFIRQDFVKWTLIESILGRVYRHYKIKMAWSWLIYLLKTSHVDRRIKIFWGNTNIIVN